MTNKRKKIYSNYIGFLVPDTLHDCIWIQSLLQGTTRSNIIRDIVSEYMMDNDWKIDNLIDRYANHLYSQWNLRWKDRTGFQDYIQKQRLDLDTVNKVPTKLINDIVARCEELHRLNQSLKK